MACGVVVVVARQLLGVASQLLVANSQLLVARQVLVAALVLVLVLVLVGACRPTRTPTRYCRRGVCKLVQCYSVKAV